jgi:hypothetical protein
MVKAVGFLLFAFTLATGHCFGQGLVSCSSGVADSLECPQVTLDKFLGQRGRQLAPDAVLFKGRINISRVCSLGNGLVFVGFGNEHSNGEAFTLPCATLSPSALFNATRNGMREGLWFHQNVFGTVTRATEYKAGERQSVLRFWSNGLPRQRIFYKQGKPSSWGQKRYDKKGYPLNGMMPF